MATLEQRAYETALRGLEVQERTLAELRSRTGTLLAAASLTASFLGAQTVQHTSRIGPLEVLALMALGASVFSCVYVLLPKRGLVFSINGGRLYEALVEVDDEAEVDRRLAYWLEDYWRVNHSTVETLNRFFFIAAVALVLQLGFWTWALADRL
jgi:hypothetical protein